MKLKSVHVAVITLALIFGGIALTSLLGMWKTANSKVPATYKEGSYAGQYNPTDIRGSYTFEEISSTFKIPLEDLGQAFGLKDPGSYASFQCKELAGMYAGLAAEGREVGVGSVRYFVALYKGLPIENKDATYLPQPAVEILKTKASLTEEQIQAVETYSVPVPDAP